MYQPTDVVLAKVKGFPAWPAMIIPTELIPQNVLKGRQKELEDDTDDEDKYIVHSELLKFRKYDGEKSQYCVKFFWDDSYIWLKKADMKPLDAEACEAWLKNSRRKSKKLVQAYQMASRGSHGIDVWEFVEYGSAGKPDEEYVAEEPAEADGEEQEQEEEEEEEEDAADEEAQSEESDDHEIRPTRSSRRQRQKRERENTRATRSRTAKPRGRSSEDEEEEEEDLPPPPPKRSKQKKASQPEFHFEDDQDMYLVGLGPQDLAVQENVSPLVNKLSNKRNMERHVEVKLDITDRLLSVNRMFLDVLLSEDGGTKEESDQPVKKDYEVILDELDLALCTKGSHNEFLTIFQSNNELLINFRVLFNLRRDDLERLSLWDQFQAIFSSIYEHNFEPDQEPWTLNTDVVVPRDTDEDAIGGTPEK
ncbi:related to ISWI one complex protein 4 [Zygosaccharomyces bailii]|nr:related to ISWI one complex protein 4 [Zygosaccharomyces bailii]